MELNYEVEISERKRFRDDKSPEITIMVKKPVDTLVKSFTYTSKDEAIDDIAAQNFMSVKRRVGIASLGIGTLGTLIGVLNYTSGNEINPKVIIMAVALPIGAGLLEYARRDGQIYSAVWSVLEKQYPIETQDFINQNLNRGTNLKS